MFSTLLLNFKPPEESLVCVVLVTLHADDAEGPVKDVKNSAPQELRQDLFM